MLHAFKDYLKSTYLEKHQMNWSKLEWKKIVIKTNMLRRQEYV